MAVGTQRAAVDPRVGNRVDHLLLRSAKHVRDHGRRGNPYQDHVIEADAVEAVFERDDTLYFMRLDHAGQHVTHGQRRPAFVTRLAREVVGDSQDATEVVGRMTPLGRQPRVVEVEPANHRPDVECSLHRFELVRRAGHAGAVGHRRPGHDRPEQFRARRVLQRQESASERVHQAVEGRLVGRLALNLVFRSVARDVDQDLVGIRALGRLHVQLRHQ